MGTGIPAVAERWLGTLEVVADESETATAPARTKDNANALITNFIGSNLNVRELAR
jgi:hypothetical protein